MRNLLLLALTATAVFGADVRTMTLRDAVDLALKQNPDVLLSNIEEQRALAQVSIAKDPFVPKLVIGSGLAYSNGFPMSIEGSAPSVVQARAIASVYNKPQRLAIAQAKEEARAAGLGTQSKREEAIAQVVQSFLDAERRGRQAELAGKQLETAEKLLGIVKVRVTEGRELPLEGRRAELEVAKAKQRIAILGGDVEYAEGLLGMALGLPPGGLVRPAREDRDLPEVPDSAESAVNAAMADNREIRRLQSQLLAKGLQAKGHRAERLPSFDLVAQYGLFAKFNNYEDFFRRFQRNNGQLGVSFQLPLLFGPGREARASLAEIEVSRIRVQVNQTRSKIALEIQKRYADLQRADTSRQIAKMDLDLTRESLAVQLARFEEGRATMRQVEEARFQENEKWMAYYDTVTQSEGARYALLEMTGGLVAALR